MADRPKPRRLALLGRAAEVTLPLTCLGVGVYLLYGLAWSCVVVGGLLWVDLQLDLYAKKDPDK
jgi:hypothetical protein